MTPETRRIYGLAQDEAATYDRFIAIVHADDREAVAARIGSAMSGGGPFDQEYRIVPGDSTVRWMHATGRPDGPDRLLGVSIDVTERVLAENRAHEDAARVAAAVDVAELGFSEWRVGSAPPFLDGRLRELLGIGPETEEQPPEVWLSRLHQDDQDRLLDMRRRLLAGEVHRLALEYRYEHPRRGWIWLRHVSRRLEGAGGSDGPRLIGAVQDITERKQREEALRQALDEVRRLRDRLERENVYLRQEAGQRNGPEQIIGRSPAIGRALAMAEQVAVTDSTVLLLGETGSGKERFASFIHGASRRRERTMIRVNCSAIPAALIESELFGREKGAYTGALSKQIGRFELAHGSTLFIDEVGDLPPEIQVKLLRALEEHTIERLGNPRPIPVDVRIIAATHRDLERAVREGTFREDLYYRLNVFPITVPPLRERREDVPLFVDAFIDELGAAMGKRIEAVGPANIEALVAHAWPGNVRELRNVVERAMILADGGTLRVEVPHADPGQDPNSTDLTVVERGHILQVLHETGWRGRGPRGAAARLGLKPTTLESRIKKLGIYRPGTTILLSWILRNIGDWSSVPVQI